MNPKGSYGTHLHPLIVAVLATEGDVVEFGMGDYSTPILHEICKVQGRKLLSLEGDLKWAKKWTDLCMNDWHDITIAASWHKVKLKVYDYPIQPSVIFIDHAPSEQRQKDIVKYQDSCEIMVVHDTEKARYYGYDFSMFKYQYQYKRYPKMTTLLSKTIDVSRLF